MKHILPVVLGLICLASAVFHLIHPEWYAPLIPEWISNEFANIASVITEGLVGIALVVPKYRKWGGLGFMLLMIGFLPIHIWDLLKDEPFVGSTTIAIVRLVMQFVLIYLGYRIWKKG